MEISKTQTRKSEIPPCVHGLIAVRVSMYVAVAAERKCRLPVIGGVKALVGGDAGCLRWTEMMSIES